jgi:hypothetical protein
VCWKGLRVIPGARTGAAVLLAVVLGPPAPAGAATIGPDPLPTMSTATRMCLAGQPCTFFGTDPPSGSAYPSVSPVDGVVVRWRARFVGSGTSSARFRVFTKASTPGEYIADDGGDLETVVAGFQSFGTRVQIQKDDLIGLDLAGPSPPTLGLGSRGTVMGSSFRVEPQPVNTSQFHFNVQFLDSELLLNADVEADADDDGYGDVTQDPCPSDPGPEACDATLTIGAPDLTVPSTTAGDCGSETCSLWTATTPIGGERQRWDSPIDGVIVRWRVRLLNLAQGPQHPTLGPYRLRAIRKASDTEFPVVGSSALESVPHTLVASDTVHAFATRIPVLAGDRLALDMPPEKAAPVPGGLRFDLRGGTHRRTVPAPPDGGSFSTLDALFTQSPQFNADVEPDADRDGFGDVTQDACPTNAATQGACPAPPDLIGPAVDISRRTRRLTRRGVVRVRLRCPSGEPAGCLAGRLRLKSAKRVQVAVRRIVRLGSKRFSIPSGRSKVVRIRLSRRNRALVRRRGRLRVRARASAIDQAGNRRATTATFLLLPPRR